MLEKKDTDCESGISIHKDPSQHVSSSWLALRVDFLLMPLLTIAFGLQYYDKAILGSATLWGILEDLQMLKPASRYKNASAAFYYGYLFGALPMSVLVQRYKGHLNYFLGSMVVLWGAIVMLTCVITDWRGLVVQRIFLGIIESSVSPGFVAVTRMWYTKKEQPIRLGIWYSATGLFSIFSGLVNHALGETKTSLAPWKLMFLVPGTFTIIFGLILVLLLPPSPLVKPLLAIPWINSFSDAERSSIDSKVRSNLTGNERRGTSWSWNQAVEAIKDPQIWIYFLMATAIYVVCDSNSCTEGLLTSVGERWRYCIRSYSGQIHRFYLITGHHSSNSGRCYDCHQYLCVLPACHYSTYYETSRSEDSTFGRQLLARSHRRRNVLARKLGKQSYPSRWILPPANVRHPFCAPIR